MIKMVIGWISICYIIAFSLIIWIWFSESAHLNTIATKIQYTSIVLIIHIIVSFLVLVVELTINLFINDVLISKSKRCIVEKYNPQPQATQQKL